MRPRAVFDLYFHDLRIQDSSADVAVVTHWATLTTALTARIAWVSCSSLPRRSVSDSVRMRAVSKVITLTQVREAGLVWTGNLVAAPRVQATEPLVGFHIGQSSHGTEL